MKVASAFAGIGGFDRGLEITGGFEVVWQCEIDTDAQSVLRRWWPAVPLYDDVRTIHGKATCPDRGCERCVPDVDVLCGGSPCQDWSVAGRRAGLAGSRSGLFFEFAGLADSLAPRWVLFENVPGLLSACSCPSCSRRRSADAEEDEDGGTRVLAGHAGRDFAIVLDELTGFHPGVPQGGWRNAGICDGPKRTAVWRVLDARFFGVPQRRRRLVLVASAERHPRRRASCIEVLLEPDCLSGNPAAGRQAGQGAAPDAGGGAESDGVQDVAGTLGGGSGQRGWSPDTDRMTFVPEVVPAVTSKWAKGTGGPAGDETQNLVSYSTKLHNTNSNQAGKFYEYAPSLQANSPAPAVFSVYPEQGGGAALIAKEVDVCPTVTAAGMAKVSDRGALIAEPEAVAISLRGRSDGAQLELEPDEVTPPLRTGSGGSSRPMIFQQNSRSEVRLIGGDGQIAGAVAAEPGAQQQNYLAAEHRVRRLTPLECERLQGFPDGHTAGLSDSARYRLLGNAVPVPVIRWIGERLLRFADEKPEMVGVSS